MKRGFTLVELSIVLVIIGLLIGGILVAQSMISTTKVEMLVRQIQQVDVAVANYKTKFAHLPGDNPNDSANGWTPDGDGTIGEMESFLVFTPNLVNSGYIGEIYTIGANKTEIKANYGNGIAVYSGGTILPALIAPIHFDPLIIQMHYTNYYQIGVISPGCCNNPILPGGNNGASYVSYTPGEALAIDMKMDDGLTGLPNPQNYSATVIAQAATVGANDASDPTGYFISSPQNCTVAGDFTKYNPSYTDKACNLFVAMLPYSQ